MDKAQQEQPYPLKSIYFYLTEGCNLRCRHCWIAPKFQTEAHPYPFLSVDIFRSVVEQGRQLGLCSVKLTGGEPLLHPGIDDILEYVKGQDIDLLMETNGVLCTARMAQRIAACKNPFVSVSIDGADAKTHEWVRGVSGCFELAVDGVRHLVDQGVTTQIIMSVMRRNKEQVEPVVRLAEELGAESVKFNLVMPIARGERMQAGGETLSVEELVNLGAWVEGELSGTTNVRLFYSHPPAFRPLGKLFGERADGCSQCGILGIIGVLAGGAYSMCGIGENVAELVFGHAAEDRLAKVWENTAILRELRGGLPKRLEGICGNCLMKSKCLGSCIAQNFYRDKSLWAPFWYCDAASKAGLFPKNRMMAVGS